MADMEKVRSIIGTIAISAGLSIGAARAEGPAGQVQLRMGTAGGSNCVIGPQVPHGSVNPSPDTADGTLVFELGSGPSGWGKREPPPAMARSGKPMK